MITWEIFAKVYNESDANFLLIMHIKKYIIIKYLFCKKKTHPIFTRNIFYSSKIIFCFHFFILIIYLWFLKNRQFSKIHNSAFDRYKHSKLILKLINLMIAYREFILIIFLRFWKSKMFFLIFLTVRSKFDKSKKNYQIKWFNFLIDHKI